jgi:hypothetical protein
LLPKLTGLAFDESAKGGIRFVLLSVGAGGYAEGTLEGAAERELGFVSGVSGYPSEGDIGGAELPGGSRESAPSRVLDRGVTGERAKAGSEGRARHRRKAGQFAERPSVFRMLMDCPHRRSDAPVAEQFEVEAVSVVELDERGSQRLRKQEVGEPLEHDDRSRSRRRDPMPDQLERRR